MADAEVVVLAFAALGKTGQPAKLAHGVHAVFAAGQDFVAAGLLHAPQQKAAQFGGQLRQPVGRQPAQVFGQVYGIEQGSGGGHGVHLGEKTGADYIANRTAALRAQTRFQAA